MCDISALGLAIGAAGMFTNTIGASQQAKAYANYQSLNAQAALSNYIQQTKQVNLRYTQEQEASAADAEKIRIENMKAKATAQASAASSGIDGITIDNLFAGYERANAVSDYTHARNLEILGLEYTNQMDTYRNQALSSIYSMQPYTGASAGSTLLSGVGGLMTTYANNKEQQARTEYYRAYRGTGGKI